MAIKAVLLLGNPQLRQPSAAVTDFGAGFEQIVRDTRDTLHHLQTIHGLGRALAAPQIGYRQKVIVFDSPTLRCVMVNPEIVWRSAEMFRVWDRCFCFNIAFCVEVERHQAIRVRYQDERGDPHEWECAGDLSELVQHEVDHLYGILATDRLTDVKKIIMREEWEQRYQHGTPVD